MRIVFLKKNVRISTFTFWLVASSMFIYLFWLLIRIHIFDYFRIPSESMYPTLKEGDHVVVNKLLMGGRIYTDFQFEDNGSELKSLRMRGYRSIKHNDICVFNYPYHQFRLNFVINHVFCKRVAALPGDSLCIKDGYYYNNKYFGIIGLSEEQLKLKNTPDSLLYGRPFRLPPYTNKTNWTMKNYGPLYIPRKGDKIKITPLEAELYQPIIEWESGLYLTIDSLTNSVFGGALPYTEHTFLHNYYFMAGDNVLFSIDSRHWGLVPEEYIIGIVSRIINHE